MRIVQYRGDEDSPILGLASEPAGASRATLLHVHGYGGDMVSNDFVRASHVHWPSRGVSFVSLRLPTSSYIEERYTDSGVSYVGSALTLPRAAVRTVSRVLGDLASNGENVILQGHSFGTNVVKRVVLEHPTIIPAIYLSPADSARLQADYARLTDPPPRARGRGVIDWVTFGIVAGDRRYSIPIAGDLAEDLFESSEFNAWTTVNDWRPDAPSLVIQATGDPISTAGNFSERLRQGAPSNVRFIPIGSDSHSFADKVPELLEATGEWVDYICHQADANLKEPK